MKKVVSEEIRNQQLTTGRTISAVLACIFINGSYMAAYYVAIGLSTADVSLLTAFGSVGQLVGSATVLLTYKKDPSGVKTMKFYSLFYLLLSMRFFLASFYERPVALVILCASNVFFNWTENMRNSAEITASPFMYGRGNYTDYVGKLNAISYIIGLVFSCLLLFVQFDENVLITFRWFFLISTACRLGYTVLTQFLKIPNTVKPEEVSFTFRFKDILQKKYLIHSMPHFARGVGAAINGLVQTNMIQRISMTTEQLTLLVPLSYVFTILAAFASRFFARKIRPADICWVAYIFTGLIMVASVFVTTPVGYIAIVLAQSFFNALGDWNVVPSFVFAYDSEEMAVMSSLHVLTYGIMVTLSSVIFGPLVDNHLLPVMSVGCIAFIAMAFLMKVLLHNPAHPEVYHFK